LGLKVLIQSGLLLILIKLIAPLILAWNYYQCYLPNKYAWNSQCKCCAFRNSHIFFNL